MRITKIATQIKNSGRVSIYLDGKYSFSLSLAQLADSGLRSGSDLSQEEIDYYKDKSKVGKLFSRTVEYCLIRPRSKKELKDYLYKKTLPKKYKSKKDGQIRTREGLSSKITDEVYEKIIKKDLVNDNKFAKWWVENRNINKGTSFKKMRYELLSKGVNSEYIDKALLETDRNSRSEIEKIISKKKSRYKNKNKMLAYLARQGFDYNEIRNSLNNHYS